MLEIDMSFAVGMLAISLSWNGMWSLECSKQQILYLWEQLPALQSLTSSSGKCRVVALLQYRFLGCHVFEIMDTVLLHICFAEVRAWIQTMCLWIFKLMAAKVLQARRTYWICWGAARCCQSYLQVGATSSPNTWRQGFNCHLGLYLVQVTSLWNLWKITLLNFAIRVLLG